MLVLCHLKMMSWKNEIDLFHNENETVKRDAGEKSKINLLKLKVESLKKENNSLENEINSKQDLIDSVLEYHSDLMRDQFCHFTQHSDTDQVTMK